jgi:Kef-type K+ transport system membrane component KefB
MSTATAVSLAAIFLAATLAPLASDRLARWVLVPSVVLEILLGIVLGPALLGWVVEDDVVAALSEIGLAFLMFLAGYELEFARVKGEPLRTAAVSWFVSLALGVVAGLALADAAGNHAAGLVVGLALTTTALGTILPMLRDAGETETPFGSRVLAVGSVGEFGPIVAIAFLLSGDRPRHVTALLLAFAAVATLAAVLATRPRHPVLARVLSATLHSSAQLGVRISVLAVVGMLALATALGLDPVLGAFSAGIVVRLFLQASEPEEVEEVMSRVESIGFGFFIPLFFVVSGVRFDLVSLVEDPSRWLVVPLGLLLFLVVRGLPTLVAHRRVLPPPDRRALALYAATALPLVVVITSIGVDSHDLSSATAAALVAAGMLSVLLFPLVAGRVRRAAGERTGPRHG